MKNRNYYTSSNCTDHSTFGGLVCYSDFNTEYRKDASIFGSSIAKDIISDWKFDEDCRKNALNRDENRDKDKKGSK